MITFRSLLVGIVASASILLTPSQITIAQTQLAPEEISAIAKPVTVRIDGVDEGSGVIIDKSGSTYTVLTNWHVVKVIGDYTIQTYDGQKHPVDYQQTRQLSEFTDLAIVKFTSDNDYDVATVGKSDNLGEGQTIHLAGYPGNGQISGESDRIYRFNILSINAILPNSREGGYSIAYGGENFSGMSGSPILDSNGELIGINGIAYVDADGKARSNYAIPIDTYQELAATLTPESENTSTASKTRTWLDSFKDFTTNETDDFVKNKLSSVPVFTITDDDGSPLVASGENDTKVAGVFISHTDAQNFINNNLKTKNPELVSRVKVLPVSLGEIYKLAESSQREVKSFKFTYIPQEEAVNLAKNIVTETGSKKYKEGVPLFVGRTGDKNNYLTVEKDGEQVIPFFFELAQLERMIEKFREEKPELAQTVYIEVVSLEGVIDTLQTSDNDNNIIEKIVLVPSTESLDFLRKESPISQN